MSNRPTSHSSTRRRHLPAVGVAIVIVVAAAMLAFFYDWPMLMYVSADLASFTEYVSRLWDQLDLGGWIDRLRGAGLWGVLLVIGIYGLAVVIAAPSSVLTFTATLAYGWWAIPVTWAGAMIGQTAAFMIARRFFARHMAWMCERFPVTRGIERAVEQDGLRIVFLARQSPVIPFAAQNYLFGMLATRPRDYLLGSAAGIVPGTIAKVVLIQLAGSATTAGTDSLRWALIGIGIAATIWVSILIARHVRRELHSALA